MLKRHYVSSLTALVSGVCKFNDSFLVRLPLDINVINDFALQIEIEFMQERAQPVQSRSKSFFSKFARPTIIGIPDIVANPSAYIVKKRFKKTILLQTYNREYAVIERIVASEDDADLIMQSNSEIRTNIVPYSSYNLLDANLRKIIEQHENWKQERNVNYETIKQCVLKTYNIQNVADELLDILLSMLVNKTKESVGYYQVLISVLEVLRKLNQLPSNEGHRILFRFTS